MTHVIYFGAEGTRPMVRAALPEDPPGLSHPGVSIISFEPGVLLAQKVGVEGGKDKEEYGEFMKLIDFPTLRFRKAVCGSGSIFVLDTKRELWCVGACEAGQLGISTVFKEYMLWLMEDRITEKEMVPINLSRVFIDSKFSSLSAGSSHVLALSGDGLY